ncbi:MAG: hypothetical protein ABSC46_01880 [Candidatus Limnocylindrales bacterium]|jgi:uncharacterized protein YndB with AHSA1/START domain
MACEFTVSDVIPATPMAVYDAWMSNDGHGGMAGAAAEIDLREGGEFSAWDGYISGRTLALEPGRRIGTPRALLVGPFHVRMALLSGVAQPPRSRP